MTENPTAATPATPAGVPFPAATVLGYPRIGPRRELKKALERSWAGTLDAEGLTAEVGALRAATVDRQRELGLTEPAAVPASFALYDQVLDAIVATGALPARFSDLAGSDGVIDRAASFVLARGDVARGPLEMTKWFDTNYHYLVPEIGPETRFSPNAAELLAQAAAGEGLRPALVGPVTFLLLSKAEDSAPEGFDPLSRLDDLLPVYRELISELGRAGATWVQLEEPALVADQDRGDLAGVVESAYRRLAADRAESDPALFVATPYGDAEDLLAPVARSGVEAVHVDLVRGGLTAEQTALFTGEGAPALVAGVVNGRNIWRADLDAALTRLEGLRDAGARVSVATSTSLFHTPHDLEQETALPEERRRWLAFADQKIREVAVLARGLAEGREAIAAELDDARAALEQRAAARSTRDAAVRERAAALTESDWHREPAEERRAAQAADGVAGGLPAIPTTTIGSFPQTAEIRAARAAHKAGRLDDEQYVGRLREEIRDVVALQEELGLDVLVHGEPERNDMVQYFAENFDGFDVTDHGWVQSYGSRCTRPSILWGDVSRSGEGLRGEAFTVPWIGYAQSLTERPVKGMLTGPVTILAWSFVREDQPLGETADQVALALRDEVADLEAAGIGIVQVDEPALRELLPLRRRDHADYLDWSVRSFRVATSDVRPSTQIHTHLCYSEFGEVLSAIDALDADVTSVEAARSRMELLDPLQEAGFDRGIGPGVWDIHSPRVPTVDEVSTLLGAAAEVIAPDRLWANPDCGLKTRAYPETKAALTHLVEAAGRVRAEVAARGAGVSAQEPSRG
ncbi:5-methyltetrahydropteroyltriglutamate--homocysteine S-methyltransferase [Rothia sp. AR01]|uniref:5-methyltetrahydropteroyltriglutamate--homocysteine S-methyltransferase n=1 Tax=Rothia santali TaxID=2949643 RepID=A0A9X2HDJ9_9MICC|nr:5-methyltetrahydropteroyltriglutamate--homocysteine S-methyltransferase [Rothia santali]